MIKFRGFIPEQVKSYTDPTFKAGFEKLSKAKAGEVAEYIRLVFK